MRACVCNCLYLSALSVLWTVGHVSLFKAAVLVVLSCFAVELNRVSTVGHEMCTVPYRLHETLQWHSAILHCVAKKYTTQPLVITLTLVVRFQ